MPEKKDAWDKFDILFKSLVLGAIPVVIGFAANNVAQSLQRGQLIQSLVDSLSKDGNRRDIALIALDEAIPPHKKCEVLWTWKCKNDVKVDPVAQIAEVSINSLLKTAIQQNQSPEDLVLELEVAKKIVEGERRGDKDYYFKKYGERVDNYVEIKKKQGPSNLNGVPRSTQEIESQARNSQIIAALQPSNKSTIGSLAEVNLVYIQYDKNKQLAEQIQKDLQAVLISAPGIEKVQGIEQNNIRYIAVSGRVRDTSTQEAIEINRLE